jgi:hypothetical protein
VLEAWPDTQCFPPMQEDEQRMVDLVDRIRPIEPRTGATIPPFPFVGKGERL